MRVTGSRLMDLGMAATARDQEQVAAASQQVSSGMRVAKPSDDPVAWAAAQRATVKQLGVDGASAALEAARERLAQTDGALATIGDAVSQVRALAVQGANGSYDATARHELGLQARALFEAALGAANQQAPDGEYLLAGSASLAPPFAANGTYAGDATTRALPAGTFASIAGATLTAAAGIDVLPLLDRVATALETNDTALLASTLDELAVAVRQVGDARAQGGAAASVIGTTLDANAALREHLVAQVAQAVEADAIAAATELARATQALETSRLVSSHIVSLLDPRNLGL